jgi:hypothetical protein
MFLNSDAPPAYGPDASHAPPPRGRDEQLAMSLLHIVNSHRLPLPAAVATKQVRRLRRVMFAQATTVTTIYLDHAQANFYCGQQTGGGAEYLYGPLPMFGE